MDKTGERKTEQLVDGRHQRMVSGRRTYTQHHGAGPMGMETNCRGVIGHQRAQSHGIKKKIKILSSLLIYSFFVAMNSANYGRGEG